MKCVFCCFFLVTSTNVFASMIAIPHAKYYQVPVDTLLIYEHLSWEKRIIISAIRKWQIYSYSNDHLNCQFYPSCSNYFAQSICKSNTYIGVIKGIDRIIRCNTSARKYHEKNTFDADYLYDGRMIDNLIPQINKRPSKNANIAVALSIIPGLGRIYCGRYHDGIISFFSISLFSSISHKQYEKNEVFLLALSGSITMTLWMSDFYGAYRAAKTGN